MATTMEDLQRRLEAVEAEVRELHRRYTPRTRPERAPADGTILEWLEAIRREDEEQRTPHDQLMRALGVDPHRPPVGAEKIQEMMLADGVRPEECLASREILRMREGS